MIVGVPKEIKSHEYRVGLAPANVRELISNGHKVLVEANAGEGIGVGDDVYQAAGAVVLDAAEDIFAAAELIIKVKEPQPNECKMLREGQILFTFLHLAPDPFQVELLMKSGCTAIAYETVTNDGGGLPLLAPMSEVAGRMSVQAGAHCLEKQSGGRGILLGGVPGVTPAKVVVLGGGVSGANAARIAVGMGADVTILEKSLERIRQLDNQFSGSLKTEYSTIGALEMHARGADMIIGAVLVPGAVAPKLISRDLLREMNKGAVVVDIAIDQGGCLETSKATTHQNPTYIEEGVVHYCVANMPGAVPLTSTLALNNATLPFLIAIANRGWQQALKDDQNLKAGLSIQAGKVTCEAVANELNYDYLPADEVLF